MQLEFQAYVENDKRQEQNYKEFNKLLEGNNFQTFNVFNSMLAVICEKCLVKVTYLHLLILDILALKFRTVNTIFIIVNPAADFPRENFAISNSQNSGDYTSVGSRV